MLDFCMDLMRRRNVMLITFGVAPPGGYSLMWPIQGRAAGHGMVFGLSVLHRVYNLMQVCPKQGLNLS